MEEANFDAKSIRESLTPSVSRREMAKRIGISYSFLRLLEYGQCKWPEQRKVAFMGIVAGWQTAPSPAPRKLRSDAGRKRGPYPRKPAELADAT